MNAEANLQIDPNVKVPAAVRASMTRSQQLYEALRDSNLDENGQPKPLTSQGNADPAAEGQNPEPANDPGTDPASLADTPPVVLQEPAAEPQSQPQAQAQDDGADENWEHKYKSLHGRFMRQSEQLKQSIEEGQNLRNVIATMQAAPAPAADNGTSVASLLQVEELTPDETQDYGEDFLKVVGKRARQEFAPIAKAYQDEIAELRRQLQGVTGVVKEDVRAKMIANLDDALPNWREVNTNREFIDWLSLRDAYSGAIRHDMLRAAYEDNNAPRVLAFFKGFLAEEAVANPAGGEPEERTVVPKVPLKNLAAPGRAKTAAPASAPAEKPIFTRAQIAEFYADIAAGKYKGRDTDKNKLEAQIFEAQREGRIR